MIKNINQIKQAISSCWDARRGVYKKKLLKNQEELHNDLLKTMDENQQKLFLAYEKVCELSSAQIEDKLIDFVLSYIDLID